MAILEFDLDPVDAITVGVEGEPGQRSFFLEASGDAGRCTLLVEKVQLQELGAQLLQLLEAPGGGGRPAPDPQTRPGDPPGWHVGQIQLSLDEEAGRCTLLLQERREVPLGDVEQELLEGEEGDEAEDDGEGLRAARLVATIAQVRALAERSLQVVQGGRPICPLCHLPIDPGGHVCPASNGHHRS